MNYRFKYRVWDKERKCFFNDDEVILYPNGEESYFNADYDFAETVIEQCTSLKDKNSKLIYEGDILKGGYAKYKVVWQGSGFVLKVKTAGSYPLGGSADLLEVIGNIHENADLLEVDND